MSRQELLNTVEKIAIRGKGILAADESEKTIGKRFDTINVNNTGNNRRDYREMLFTTPGLNEHISGVILFEETLTQKSSQSDTLGQLLTNQGIVPGIKVDKGLIDLNKNGDKVTQGLDGLSDRLIQYKENGAKFAKWRAVYSISQHCSRQVIHSNAHALARYAAICQSQGVVPIVEPEVLMDGTHSIERCAQLSECILRAVFNELFTQDVLLEGIILKPSMIITGSDCPLQASIDDVALETVKILKRTVPAAVPTINFLSGGQSAVLATQHLNKMNKLHDNLPWQLSFSYGRALQAPSLELWQGNKNNTPAAQQALQQRAKLNGFASLGQYEDSMENNV